MGIEENILTVLNQLVNIRTRLTDIEHKLNPVKKDTQDFWDGVNAITPDCKHIKKVKGCEHCDK